jgi:hypothetical protein
MLAAMRRASSQRLHLVGITGHTSAYQAWVCVSGEQVRGLPVSIADDEAGVRFLSDPGRRESGAWRALNLFGQGLLERGERVFKCLAEGPAPPIGKRHEALNHLGRRLDV